MVCSIFVAVIICKETDYFIQNPANIYAFKTTIHRTTRVLLHFFGGCVGNNNLPLPAGNSLTIRRRRPVLSPTTEI